MNGIETKYANAFPASPDIFTVPQSPDQPLDQPLDRNEIENTQIETFAQKVAKAKASQAEAKSKYNIETTDPDQLETNPELQKETIEQL